MGDHPVLARLRQKLTAAEVADRRLSRRGIVVTIAVPAAIGRMPVDSAEIADVAFSHPAAPSGGAASLSIEQGYVEELDISCYIEELPRNHAGFTRQYIRRSPPPPDGDGLHELSDERDMAALIAELEGD